MGHFESPGRRVWGARWGRGRNDAGRQTMKAYQNLWEAVLRGGWGTAVVLRPPAVGTTVDVALEAGKAGGLMEHSTEHGVILCLLVRSWEDGCPTAWFSDNQGGEAFASLDLASIGDGAIKITIAIEIVFDEAAIGQPALDEAAIVERRAAKDAICEATVNEIDDIEHCPVQVEPFEGAAHKMGSYVSPLHREAGEIAVAEPAIFPVDAGEVLLTEVFQFHWVCSVRHHRPVSLGTAMCDHAWPDCASMRGCGTDKSQPEAILPLRQLYYCPMPQAESKTGVAPAP